MQSVDCSFDQQTYIQVILKAEKNSTLVNLPLAPFWGDLSQTVALQADARLGANVIFSFSGYSLGTEDNLHYP